MKISYAPILIVGGSLAGMAAAIRLKQLGIDSVVFEKSKFPRAKLCGEFLAPDAMVYLNKLGVNDLVQSNAAGKIVECRFYSEHKSFNVPMSTLNSDYPYGLAITREKLDNLLLEYGKKIGVSIFEETQILPQIKTNSDNLILQVRGKPHLKFESKFLIDASGRNSNLSLAHDKLQRKEVNKNLVGISFHIETEKPLELNILNMFLFPGGYGGILPHSLDSANLCLLTSSDLLKDLNYQDLYQRTIAQNKFAHQMVDGCSPSSDFLTTGNINLNLPNLNQQSILKIGDALITLDPFIGSGMAFALETGIIAAECFAGGINEGKNYKQISDQYYKIFYKRFKLRIRSLRCIRSVISNGYLQKKIFYLAKPALPLLLRAIK